MERNMIGPACDNLVLGDNLQVYLRSASEAGSSSVARQLVDLKETLELEGHVVSGWPGVPDHAPELGVYTDKAISGWNYSPMERAACRALIEWCERNPRDPAANPGYILVRSLSRLGQFKEGVSTTIYWLERLKRAGWIVHSVTQPGLSDDRRFLTAITDVLVEMGERPKIQRRRRCNPS